MNETIPDRKRMEIGDALIFIAMLLFGGYSLFLRFFPTIPTVTFLFAFQFVGACSFFAIVRSRKERYAVGKKEKLLLGTLAVVAILNDLFYFFSFRLTTIANAAVAHQMVSVFLLLFAPLFLGQKTKRSEWIALPISLLGIVIIYSGGIALDSTRDIWGITFGLASSIFYALLIVLYGYLPKQGLSISVINLWRYTISAILLLPFMIGFGGFNITVKDILPLIAFGLLFAVIASGIHNYGMSKTRALHASIIGKTEPVIATLYALAFLGETPSVRTIIGGILIIGSSVWLAFQEN